MDVDVRAGDGGQGYPPGEPSTSDNGDEGELIICILPVRLANFFSVCEAMMMSNSSQTTSNRDLSHLVYRICPNLGFIQIVAGIQPQICWACWKFSKNTWIKSRFGRIRQTSCLCVLLGVLWQLIILGSTAANTRD